MTGEARGEGCEGGLVVLGVDHLAGLVRAFGLWGDDLGGRDGAALGDGGGGGDAAL